MTNAERSMQIYALLAQVPNYDTATIYIAPDGEEFSLEADIENYMVVATFAQHLLPADSISGFLSAYAEYLRSR